ncbi:MAG: DUF3795 domain-containing protein [Clostridiales bacterium]|nr:DUF3795 domain-containing protein [Clostridiales bacterium]
MKHISADDGRILTPPKELETLLKGAFPAFYKLLGHLRWFYVADEIWDGKSSLIFKAGDEQLAAVTLRDTSFHVDIADETFRIDNEAALNDVFSALEKHAAVHQRRPHEQLAIDPNGCPCGRRCDLCLGSSNSDEKNFTAGENFGYMNWVCYHGCLGVEVERFEGVFKCPGCRVIRTAPDVWPGWKGCKTFICLSAKGYANCAACGEYHSCDFFSNCHHPAQCNIGISAEEITKLVIPYATKERLDYSISAAERGE